MARRPSPTRRPPCWPRSSSSCATPRRPRRRSSPRPIPGCARGAWRAWTASPRATPGSGRGPPGRPRPRRGAPPPPVGSPLTVSYELSPEDRAPTTREPEPAPPPEPAPRVVESLAQRSAEDRSRVLGALSRTSGNRAVTALLQRDPVLPAPPKTDFKAASSMHAYIDLVKALEKDYPAASPREILTLLRTVYYGKPWSVSPTA